MWKKSHNEKRLLLFLLIGISFLLLGLRTNAQISGESANAYLILSLGQSTKINLNSQNKIHISDGSVIRARKIGNQMVLTGKKMGRAELRFLASRSQERDKTIYVTDRKTAETARRFASYLDETRGLYLDASALPSLIVRGELLRIEDWAYLVDLARTQQIAWQLQAAIFPQQKLRKALIHELRHLAWASDYLKIENNGISIVTNREKEKISAQDALQLSTLGVRIDVSSSANELEPMIRTKVVIAEVRRSVTQKLGIKWPESFQIGGESSVINISSVTALLEAIETTGEGRILAMPNLLCRSGGEAKFFAGGEIPIRTSNYRTTSVEWKKYGITLHVQPRADRMKRLKFQLRTEISSIDDSNKSSQDIPGITSNSIETQFNLAGAQTIALSGLIKREEGRHLSNLGILNSIPILGKLFESQDFRKMVTELIIFLTPEISFPGFAEGAER